MKLDPDQVTTEEVMTWTGLHLFHYQMSSCSQKVRILMAELDVDFVSHHIDLRKDEQKSAWYLGINPNGVVPTLVHDGDVHIESNDIIQYLDENFSTPSNSLFPTHEDQQVEMQTLLDLEDQLHVDLRKVTFTYLAPDIHGDMNSDEESFEYINHFYQAFSTLNQKLSERTYLLGNTLSLADISWFITLHRLHLARYPLQQHPALNVYYQRLAKRPTFKQQAAAGPAALRLAGMVYRNLRKLKRSLRKDFQSWAN